MIKKSILLIVMLLLILSGCSDKNCREDFYVNTDIHSSRGGMVYYYDNYVYYGYKDGVAKIDESGNVSVVAYVGDDCHPQNFNYYEDKLYFTAKTDKKMLYYIDLKTSELNVLFEYEYGSDFIIKNHIIFSSEYGDISIYDLKKNESIDCGIKNVVYPNFYQISVSDDGIFCVELDKNSNTNLIKYDFKSRTITPIYNSKFINDFCIYEDDIFFIDGAPITHIIPSSIIKVDENGEEKEVVPAATDYIIHNNKIYYVVFSCLYESDLDGTTYKKLDENYYSSTGSHLYAFEDKIIQAAIVPHEDIIIYDIDTGESIHVPYSKYYDVK